MLTDRQLKQTLVGLFFVSYKYLLMVKSGVVSEFVGRRA